MLSSLHFFEMYDIMLLYSRWQNHCQEVDTRHDTPLVKVNAAYSSSIAYDDKCHDDEDGTAHHATTTTATTTSEFDLTMTIRHNMSQEEALAQLQTDYITYQDNGT